MEASRSRVVPAAGPRRNLILAGLGLLAVAAIIGAGAVVDLSLTLALLLAGGIILFLPYAVWRGLRSPLALLYLILLAVPFHTIAVNLLRLQAGLPSLVLNLFSAWKEAALFLVLGLVVGDLLIKRRKVSRTVLLPLYLSFVGLALAFVFLAPELPVGLYQFRNLFIGLPILLTLYLMRPRLDRFLSFVDVIAVQGVLLTGVAFYQVYLTDFYTFLTRFGFVPPGTSFGVVRYASVFTVSGQLFWRANSLFSGPNEFGLFNAQSIVLIGSLLLYARKDLGRARRWVYTLILPVLLAGEFISMSRNSWILIAVAGITMFIKLRMRYQVVLATGAVLLAAGMVLFVPPFQRFVVRTVTLQDSSAAGRVEELERTASRIIERPLGRGLGAASYKAARLDFQPIHTEYFVFMMALEIGLLGLLWYLFVMSQFGLACAKRGWRAEGIQRSVCWGASGLVFGMMASQFFAIISLDWLFQMYLWFFVGLALWGSPPQGSRTPEPTPRSTQAGTGQP